jgi:two-component system response regulator DegU
VLVDDHELFSEMVQVTLSDSNRADHDVRFEVVGTASTGSEVLPLVSRLRPDLVLLDIGLPGIDGLSCLDLLRDRLPDVRVVMLSADDQPERIQSALRRGASGYILKTIGAADLASALRQVIEGSVFVPPPPQTDPVGHDLSDREGEILRHLARGLSNRAIARELYVTEQTVKFHLTNAYRKLGVPNRTAAANAAHKLGIAPNPILSASVSRLQPTLIGA